VPLSQMRQRTQRKSILEARSLRLRPHRRSDSGQPVENLQRQLWVTETALATALNMGYLAENITMFGIVVGIALVLTGVGFLVLTLGGTLRSREADSAAAVRGTPATV
jgi:hypothetical protein